MKRNKSDEEINWKKTITRPTSPLKIIPFLREISQHRPPLKNYILIPKEGKHTIVLSEGEMKKFGGGSLEDYNREGFEDFADRTVEVCDKFLEIAKEIKNKDHEGLTKEQLRDLFTRSQERVKKLGPSLFGFMLLQKTLKDTFKKKLEERDIPDKYLDIFTRKVKLNENEKEQRDLLRIAKKVKAKGYTEEVEKELEEHKEEYQWCPEYDYNLDPWTLDDFKERIKDLKDTAEEKLSEKKSPERLEEELNNALEEVGTDQELRDWVRLVQRYVYLRTYRTNMLRKFYHRIKPFIHEIAGRMGWDKELMPYFTPRELEEYLKTGKKPDKEEIKRRSEKFLLIRKWGAIKIYSRDERIKKIMREELPEVKEVKKLEGEGIYPGVAEGKVKLVEDAESGGKLERGEILVSTMTTPDMSPIIKRASAIVTDEGGMTCHAAVISKEMGVPCVVGAEEATEVLEDGQKVKVDAEKGIVEVLE